MKLASVLVGLMFWIITPSLQASPEVEVDVDFIAYSVDTNTLHMVPLSNLEPELIGDINLSNVDLWEIIRAYHDQVYMIERNDNKLITISLADASVISSVQLDQDVQSTRGFDVSPEGILYGIFNGSELRTVNTDTGSTTLIGDIKILTEINEADFTIIEAMAFAPTGTLYAVGSPISGPSDHLYTLDPLTGILDLIGQLDGVTDIDTLTFGPDGFLYGVDSLAGTLAELYRISPTDVSVINLGAFGLNEVNGLFAIPEPATLSLLALGALALTRRRKKT